MTNRSAALPLSLLSEGKLMSSTCACLRLCKCASACVCVCGDALTRVFVCRLLWRHHLPSGLKVQGPHGGKANVTGQASQCQVPTNDVRRSPHCHCPNKQPCRPVRSPPDPSAPLSFACNDGNGDLGIKAYPGVALSDSPPARKSAESLKTSIIYL